MKSLPRTTASPATHFKKSVAASLLAVAAAAVFSACSNSNDQMTAAPPSAPATPPSVPASAVTDIPAFVGYLSALAANDSQEALLVDVTPPTSETVEPIIVM